MNCKQIQRKIESIKRQLIGLGPMHPGSLSRQLNVCGNPGCRCKNTKNPQRHGPYHQLSYTWRGKSSTRFVRRQALAKMQEKIYNYSRFRELMNHWVDLSIALETAERTQSKENGDKDRRDNSLVDPAATINNAPG